MGEYKFSSVRVDSVFLNKYMGKVPNFYISVYICAKSAGINISEISKILSADEKQTEDAVNYWLEKGEIEEVKKKGKFCRKMPILGLFWNWHGLCFIYRQMITFGRWFQLTALIK